MKTIVLTQYPLTWREVLHIKNDTTFEDNVKYAQLTGYDYFYRKGKIFDNKGYQIGTLKDFNLTSLIHGQVAF